MIHRLGILSFALLMFAAVGCKGAADSAAEETSCSTPAGVSGSPTSVEDAVALLNALSQPTLTCFLQSLARPLKVNATTSTASAQPAVGSHSPRIFIFESNFVMAVVPEGPGKDLLEFSQLNESQSRSVKAELKFPVVSPVLASLPFDRIRTASGTTCGSCHTGEVSASGVAFATAFESEAIRPRTSSLASIEGLVSQASSCDEATEPDRCSILKAIFGQGSVETQDFPDAMNTFFP